MSAVGSVQGCVRDSQTHTYLGREISDDVCQVTTPECCYALLFCDTCKAVQDATVTFDFSTTNTGVGILCLDDQLNTLDGSCASLCNGTRHSTYMIIVIHERNYIETIGEPYKPGQRKPRAPYYSTLSLSLLLLYMR